MQLEDWAQKVVDEARSKYGSVEVKKTGNRYYLSRVSSVYDPEKKRARKISGEYLGRITPQGLVKAEKRRSSPRSVYEYGNGRFLHDVSYPLIHGLQVHFSAFWREIIAMAIVKATRSTPMKYMSAQWEKLYLSRNVEANVSPQYLSQALRSVGKDWASQRSFFSDLMDKKETILFDLSSIFSRSENIRMAEKGYNRHHVNVRQINFAMAFSSKRHLPVMLKSLPGSVRDVKSLHSTMEEFDLGGYRIILDRGFFSYKNVEYFMTHGIEFIQPLKRGSILIDYALAMESSFTYKDRGIRCVRRDITMTMRAHISWDHDTRIFLYLYEDVKLRGEEESSLIVLIGKGKIRSYDKEKLGKVSIISNIDAPASEIYEQYKSREEVEQAFDDMKNELEEDKTYLQDDESVWGYFFVVFLSIYMHFRVLGIIRSHDLAGKLSVKEVILQLSRIYMVTYADGKTGLLEIPKKVEDLLKDLRLNILPKL